MLNIWYRFGRKSSTKQHMRIIDMKISIVYVNGGRAHQFIQRTLYGFNFDERNNVGIVVRVCVHVWNIHNSEFKQLVILSHHRWRNWYINMRNISFGQTFSFECFCMIFQVDFRWELINPTAIKNFSQKKNKSCDIGTLYCFLWSSARTWKVWISAIIRVQLDDRHDQLILLQNICFLLPIVFDIRR